MPMVPADRELRLARAKRYMRARMRGLNAIDDDFRRRFGSSAPLHHFELLPQLDVDYRAYIFFENEVDVEACEADGTAEQMRIFILDRLSDLKTEDGAVKVRFEFDSHENVLRNYEGNYFLRMR